MITIEEARPEHVEVIVSLWEELMEIHKNLDDDFFDATVLCDENYEYNISETIKYPFAEKKVFVALKNQKVVGYVTVEIVRFSMLLYNLAPLCVIGDMMINENYRKQGIGKLFIKEAEKLANEFNVKKLMLNVFGKNKVSYEYYKQQGFEVMMYRMTKMV